MYEFYRILTSLLPVPCPYAPGNIHFHASSVGEVNAAFPLIKLFPNSSLSVFTSSGYRYALSLGLNAVRFPLDSPRCVRRMLEGKRALILVETEIWPNLISVAKEIGMAVFIVNGTLNEGAYRWYRRLKIFRKISEKVDLVLAQSEVDAQRFSSIGFKNVEVVGNLKFDSVERPVKEVDLGTFKAEGALLFASVRGKEISDIAEAVYLIRKFHDRRVIVAVRHLENVSRVSSSFRRRGFTVSYLSEPEDTDVLVVDTIGDLWSLYRFSSVVFVGGTLRKYGGHSFIEPAYWGKPIVSGPHFYRQPYVRDMVAQGAVIVVRTYEELAQTVITLLSNPDIADEVGRRSREFYEKNRGVVKRVYSRIVDKIGT